MISIAYMTNRLDPQFDWFIHSLNREATPENKWSQIAELIVVDFHANEPGRWAHLTSKVKIQLPEHVKIKHITPKPCPYQGEFRISKDNHFAASNARNTAFIVCESEYIVFVDDLSFFAPGWLDNVLWSKAASNVILGAYTKVNDVIVDETGEFSFKNALGAEGNIIGVDSRLSQAKEAGANQVTGSWLFGCSFGLPLDLAFQVNGFDEACDSLGFEDVLFGIRLGRATNQIYYCPNMFTYESDELHSAPGNQKFVRECRKVTEHGSMRDQVEQMSDHAILNWTTWQSGTAPFFNRDLREANAQYSKDRTLPFWVHRNSRQEAINWWDGSLISSL